MALKVVTMAELRSDVLTEPVRTGETVADVCRRYGISRDTYYRYRRRYLAEGLDGLEDRSRRPGTSPAQVSVEVEIRICDMRRDYPRWGARRIRAELAREGLDAPAVSTIHQVLRRNGLVAIDTDTWEAIDTPDLTIQFVRSSNGQVLGTDTISLQPWTDHPYLLSVGETGVIETRGPFTNSSGLCESSGGGHLICFEYGSTATRIRVIDVETQATFAERAIGSTDVLHPNGVLEDWLPLTNN